MLAAAERYRNGQLQPAIVGWLAAKGITPATAVLVDDHASAWHQLYSGVLLTLDHRFCRFSVVLNDDESEVIEVKEWDDITATIEVDSHRRGIGQTFGALAFEILREFLKPPRQ
jgi:hypothetical protein